MSEELRFIQIAVSATTVAQGEASTLHLYGLTRDGQVYKFDDRQGWIALSMTDLSEPRVDPKKVN